MIKNWLKIYWYHTVKNKMYFLLTVIGLAIGLLSVILSSLYYLEESSYDKWNPNKEEVYVVMNKGKTITYSSQPMPLGRTIKESSSVVEDYMYYNSGYTSELVEYNGKGSTIEKVFLTQDNFFSFFPFDFVYGSTSTVFKNPNDVAIEQDISEQLFGKGVNSIGKEIVIKDKHYIVSGVYSVSKKKASISPNIVLRDLNDDVLTNDNWYTSNFSLLVKTKDSGKVREAINQAFLENYYKPIALSKGISVEELMKEQRNEFYTEPELYVLKGLRLSGNEYHFPERDSNIQMLKIMSGLSVLILVLSVFNYINLTLSQILGRGKEIGIRKAIGANKKDVVLQGLFEALITVVISLLISIVFVELILPFVNVFVKADMVFSIVEFLPILIGILICTIFIVGGFPALYLANYETLSVLKGSFHRSKKGDFVKNTFLVIQFAIACFFTIGSLIVNQQVNFMLNKDLGFKGDQVIGIPFMDKERWDEGEERLHKYFNFKEELLKMPGVEGVAISSSHFGGRGGSGVFTYYPYKEENILTEQIAMDYEYFDLYEIKMKEGRNIAKEFASDSISNVVINESFVESMKESSPIGKFIEGKNYKYQIIGVVTNFNTSGLESKVPPKMYTQLNTNKRIKTQFAIVSIKLNQEDIPSALKTVEKIWNKYNIGQKEPFTYEFVDKQFAKTFDRVLLERKVFSVLNYVVLFIALFGLFAVSSFTIGTKLKEVAIRKVLGADTSSLLKRLSMQYVVYCVLGFAIAVFPSYYFLNKWLSNYAFRIEIGWGVFVISFVVILCLTLLIVLSRAYAATRINVLKYIKYE
ncbi:ABC transporter permease [Myroides phaeus]|uniref:Putative ABC transport system permease protein n=1 Tax=Myroides phaeus TaxID=702745 RepID=A0A1G8FFA7_9FLAO|nr:FtsX-like permease family protein [Myroides phaeus]SDH80803.1 putative ABC transport system permease protein [Myroides phaeus]